jgi:hypothetical protein
VGLEHWGCLQPFVLTTPESPSISLEMLELQEQEQEQEQGPLEGLQQEPQVDLRREYQWMAILWV